MSKTLAEKIAKKECSSPMFEQDEAPTKNPHRKILIWLLLSIFVFFPIVALSIAFLATLKPSSNTMRAMNLAKEPEKLIAVKVAPLYTEPDLNSKRVMRHWAKKPEAAYVGMHYDVKVLDREPGWCKVQDLSGLTPETDDDIGWVPEEYLAASIPDKEMGALQKERMDAVNKFMGEDRDFGRVYAGIEKQGEDITVRVTDLWNNLSDDMKTAFVKRFLTLWGAFGGGKGIKENANELRLTVVHKDSGRVLATYDALFGLRLR